MSDSIKPVIYQLKIILLNISPMIWRRILVSSDSTIEDLHNTIQIVMGWEDIHLHHFIIYGKHYGVNQPGGELFDDSASDVKLSTFNFRKSEKFIYEYDFSISPAMGVHRHWWRHQIRVEAILTPKTNKNYPICTGGKGICPPENCGGPWGFMTAKQEYFIGDIVEKFSSILQEEKWVEEREQIRELQTWLLVYLNQFDYKQVNQRFQKEIKTHSPKSII
jgi:hypothetical protein